jgi:flavin reductase (DIM6/NTAB) family NADH-FMN oxidoreductase RutF
MSRKSLEFPDGITDCINATRSGGTILVAGDGDSCNGMTIGWVTIGSVWGRPMCVVLVRYSRYTYEFMEKSESFTVNQLPADLKGAVDLFGTRSGRDMDKFKEARITTAPGLEVSSPYIAESDYAIECKTAFKSPMDPELISADFVKGCYPTGDYHMVYYGEIVAIHEK